MNSTVAALELISIVGGPCKFDLAYALMTSPREWISRGLVFFETQIPGSTKTKRVNVSLTSIEAEDGSRESWNIRGYAVGDGPSRRVKIYFRTDNRKGHLSYEK